MTVAATAEAGDLIAITGRGPIPPEGGTYYHRRALLKELNCWWHAPPDETLSASYQWHTPRDGTYQCEPPVARSCVMGHISASHRWYVPRDGTYQCELPVACSCVMGHISASHRWHAPV
ncbi:hypothetical protein AVEN_126386-1 [Araneus ventricosus]|uniref:Uncharacterized protein n=1 Tax=Araneus ventricosus TaxID=182803 RepID=A0A4Y2VJI6_ARAVE|nr:hypothetical protein AVEN_260461-1 [Araneus ventricosus]GBO24474.1 hypothetical protein AVEN_126386-1 [Araneus ventricosus]